MINQRQLDDLRAYAMELSLRHPGKREEFRKVLQAAQADMELLNKLKEYQDIALQRGATSQKYRPLTDKIDAPHNNG